MKTHKLIFLALLTFTLMGASKCEEAPPPHVSPDLTGAWQWSCVDLISGPVIAQKPSRPDIEPLALTCAQQVPVKSPFMSYVKEHIEFKKDITAWSAFFGFGTCVDTQDGSYKYSYVEADKKDVLEIFDAQGTLQQTYSVEKVSDVELKFTNDVKSCNLTKSTTPQVVKGSHPKPAGITIDWDFDIDGAVVFFTTGVQFPFIYQVPQLQGRGTPFGDYRADHVLLNIGIDGAELKHYAAMITLYDNATNTPLASSVVKELVAGAVFTVEFNDPANGSLIKVKAQFN